MSNVKCQHGDRSRGKPLLKRQNSMVQDSSNERPLKRHHLSTPRDDMTMTMRRDIAEIKEGLEEMREEITCVKENIEEMAHEVREERDNLHYMLAELLAEVQQRE
jgi:predicted nuclease with TOPRIM domain